jgi:hypothetical protein
MKIKMMKMKMKIERKIEIKIEIKIYRILQLGLSYILNKIKLIEFEVKCLENLFFLFIFKGFELF